MHSPLAYLTLPGFGGSPKPPPPPPPPAPPPPAPTMVDAAASRQAADARTRARRQQGMGGTVRNRGGALGLDTEETQRALKTLTGQ